MLLFWYDITPPPEASVKRRGDSFIDMTHGYWPAPQQARLNWMKYWLAGDPQMVGDLPEQNPIPEADLMCYPPGERPEACGYKTVRKIIAETVKSHLSVGDEREGRADLARLIGWKAPVGPAVWTLKRTLAGGMQMGAIVSPRALPLPVVTSGELKKDVQEIRLLLSPDGKSSPFVIKQ